MTGEFAHLTDDQGIPVRIKMATVISVVAALIAVATLIANAGADKERLNNLSRRTEALETLPPRVDRLEVQMGEVQRRLEAIDKKLDRILERMH